MIHLISFIFQPSLEALAAFVWRKLPPALLGLTVVLELQHHHVGVENSLDQISYNMRPAGKTHQQRSAQLKSILDSFLDRVSTTCSAGIKKRLLFLFPFNVERRDL